MLRGVVSRGLVAGAVVAGTLVGAAAPAWAPKYILGTSAYGDCEPAGQPESMFAGDLTVLSFSSSGGRLFLTAGITGSCVDGTDVVAVLPPSTVTFAVESVTAECNAESAVVEVRPGAALAAVPGRDVAGAPLPFRLDLSGSTVVDRIWMNGDPRSLRARLCAVDAMAARRPVAALAKPLGALLLRV